MFKIDCLTLSRQLYRSAANGDGASASSAGGQRKTAQEIQDEIQEIQDQLRRYRNILQMAENFPETCNPAETINVIIKLVEILTQNKLELQNINDIKAEIEKAIIILRNKLDQNIQEGKTSDLKNSLSKINDLSRQLMDL